MEVPDAPPSLEAQHWPQVEQFLAGVARVFDAMDSFLQESHNKQHTSLDTIKSVSKSPVVEVSTESALDRWSALLNTMIRGEKAALTQAGTVANLQSLCETAKRLENLCKPGPNPYEPMHRQQRINAVHALHKHDFARLCSRLLRHLNHRGQLRVNGDAVQQKLSHTQFLATTHILKALQTLTDDNKAHHFSKALVEEGVLHLLYENICLCRCITLSPARISTSTATSPSSVEEVHQQQQTRILSLVHNSVALTYNIVRVRRSNALHFLPVWRGALHELISLSTTEGIDDSLGLLAMLLLCYVVNDDNSEFRQQDPNEDEGLSRYCSIVQILVQMVDLATKGATTNKESPYPRVLGFSVEEMLDVLVLLTVYPKMKTEMFQHGGVEVMKRVCLLPWDREAFRASRVICNLLLDENLRNQMEERHGLTQYFEKLRETGSSRLGIVRKNIETALWLLGGGASRVSHHHQQQHHHSQHHHSSHEHGSRSNSRSSVQQQHQSPRRTSVVSQTPSTPCPRNVDQLTVFISYATENRDIVHAIYHRLQRDAGFHCWIDTENMDCGSTLNLIAQGLEQCHVVLLCMSSAYKASHWCQLEATYAMQMKKPLVPVIVQLRYKPDGWLGLILSDRTYYEFSERRDFDDSMQRLITAILKLAPAGISAAPNPLASPIVESPRESHL